MSPQAYRGVLPTAFPEGRVTRVPTSRSGNADSCNSSLRPKPCPPPYLRVLHFARRFRQLLPDFPPVRAVPKEVAAPGANEVIVNPPPGPGRNAIAHFFLFGTAQFTAATHTPRRQQRQPKLTKHQRQLLFLGEGRGQP